MNLTHLHPYQTRAVDYIQRTPMCALWMDMGLGKTVTVLTALSDMLKSFQVNRVLVIAPKRVAAHVWPDEIEQWDHLTWMNYRLALGSPAKRLQAIHDTDAEITIINRENIPWLVKTVGDAWPWDCVVVDEASSFKSSKAKRFKQLRRMRKHITRMIQLTGTPASNGLLDIWSQLYLLDGGHRLGRTYTQYRDRWFASDYMGWNWAPKPDAEAEIYDRISDVVTRLSAQEYAELPDRFDNYLWYDLPQHAERLYRELRKDMIANMDDKPIVAQNAAVLTGKLLQVASGAVYTDDGYDEIHNAKLVVMEDLLGELGGENCIVAYNFRSSAARLKLCFPFAVDISEDNAIDDWNAGEIKMLLCHPQSAGHGLNLQAGGRILIWFDTTWSLELYDQMNARLHRQGQTKPVIVHHLVGAETVEEEVLQVLTGKKTVQDALLSAMGER